MTEPKGGARFPKTRRLLKHSDFDRVYRQGRRHASANLGFAYLRREDAAGARVGFTVSRAFGGAVERNRLKRRLREAVRLTLAGFTGAVDVVINPRKSAVDVKLPLLREEIARAFAVIGDDKRGPRPTEHGAR